MYVCIIHSVRLYKYMYLPLFSPQANAKITDIDFSKAKVKCKTHHQVLVISQLMYNSRPIIHAGDAGVHQESNSCRHPW